MPFVRKFNIDKIIEDMETNNRLKHIKFNRYNNNYRNRFTNKIYGKQIKVINYTYTRTNVWSDNNHLCKTNYYKKIIKKCRDGCFMELEVGLSLKTIKEQKYYGTYIFGSINENPYIKHTDGRRNKYSSPFN